MESLHIHELHGLNPWAVLVSAALLWVLGAVWYSPALFAKPWMAALKIQPPAAMTPAHKKSLLAGMIASLIGDLVLAFVLWHMVSWAHAHTFAWGAFVGVLCWIGFVAAPNFPQGIYEQRPFSLFAINSGYWFVCLLLSGGLLAVWR